MSLMIDSSLANLVDLGEFLSDEMVEQTIDGQFTPKGKACKEALMSMRVLVQKLEAVKGARSINEKQLQFCEICDEP